MIFLIVSESRGYSSLIGLLLAFCIIIVGAYYLTYYVAKFQKKVQQQRNLQIIEAISVGQGKNIQLVRMGNKYSVIGISRGNIQLLLILDKEDIVLHDDIERQSTIPFKQILAKYKLDKDGEHDKKNEKSEDDNKRESL
jgi:flagellar protein FliO/FliZ